MRNKVFLEMLNTFGTLYIDHTKETDSFIIYFVEDAEGYQGQVAVFIDKTTGEVCGIANGWEQAKKTDMFKVNIVNTWCKKGEEE